MRWWQHYVVATAFNKTIKPRAVLSNGLEREPQAPASKHADALFFHLVK